MLIYIYSFCDGNAAAAEAKYQYFYPNYRIHAKKETTKVWILFLSVIRK